MIILTQAAPIFYLCEFLSAQKNFHFVKHLEPKTSSEKKNLRIFAM